MRQIFENFKLAGFENPRMIVEDGRIFLIGDGMATMPGDPVDLQGHWIAPGFIDSHCHILPTGLDLQRVNLGGMDEHQQVLDTLSAALESVEPGRWLQCVHYDQNRFPNGEHLTRDQLDSVSSVIPILLRHVNGHASVANSAALQAAGVTESTPDPSGGKFVRDASGRMNGLLTEDAHDAVTKRAPEPTVNEMTDAICQAAKSMASLGVTSATDMMTGRWHLQKELEAYRLAAERDQTVRFSLFAQWATVLGPRKVNRHVIDEQLRLAGEDWVRLLGLKIFADGAIGSATAAIYGAYEGGVANAEGISGQFIYSHQRLNQMILDGDEAGYQIAVHAIGDAAVDAVMQAFAATSKPSLHRLEHAMILSDAQIEKIALQGNWVTMQPEFLTRFGHAYRAQLGQERASKLFRMASVKRAGIPLALNSDRPIVSGDPWTAIEMATSRPEGYDASENLSWNDAYAAHTSEAARMEFTAGRRGELKAGALADFIVLDQPPAEVVRPKLIATYTGGKKVFDA